MEEIKLLKELTEKTLERIVEKFGDGAGKELKDMDLSIWDARCILYEEFNKISERIFNEKIRK